jgi:hypothetical protein
VKPKVVKSCLRCVRLLVLLALLAALSALWLALAREAGELRLDSWLLTSITSSDHLTQYSASWDVPVAGGRMYRVHADVQGGDRPV